MIGFDGTIYVGSCDKRLYAIYSNGLLKWQYETVSEVVSSPAMSSSKMLFVASRVGALYAFSPDKSAVPSKHSQQNVFNEIVNSCPSSVTNLT